MRDLVFQKRVLEAALEMKHCLSDVTVVIIVNSEVYGKYQPSSVIAAKRRKQTCVAAVRLSRNVIYIIQNSF